MDNFDLTLAQAWVVINALHTAAEAYEGFARDSDAESIPIKGIATQFRKQAQQALDLATLISEA